MWKMTTPHKIKLFVWHACKNELSSLLRLKEKNVLVDGLCPFCQAPNEDVHHNLLSCVSVWEWWLWYLPCMSEVQQLANFFHTAKWIRNRGRAELLAQVFVFAWGLWGRRNKWLYEKIVQQPKAIFYQAFSQLAFFTKFRQNTNPTLKTLGCWQPPKNGSFKLNTNGENFESLQAIGLGAVLRDYKGDIVFVASIKENLLPLLKTIECLTILRGLQHCLPLGVT